MVASGPARTDLILMTATLPYGVVRRIRSGRVGPPQWCQRALKPTPVLQISLLRRSIHATKRRVAMREPAELADDRVMLARPTVGICTGQRLMQAHRDLLVLEILGMLEGQVEKETQQRIDLRVVLGGDGLPREIARERIGGVSVRRAAEDVARNLVEQQQQRERTVRRVHPRVERAQRRGEVRVVEQRLAFAVER